MKNKLRRSAALAAAVSMSTTLLPYAAFTPMLAAEPEAETAHASLVPEPKTVSWQGEWLQAGGRAAIVESENADSIAIETLKAALQAKGIVITDGEDADTFIYAGEADDAGEKRNALLDAAGLDAASLKADGYVLASGSENGHTWIAIEGADERGTFYGVQTLKQMLLEKDGTIQLEAAAIEDEPAMATRGSIEGFYAHVSNGGLEWSWQQRQEQVRFYGQTKMNTYIYAPKDDPYHRTQWRDAYPADQLEGLKATVQAAKENHVDFVFALSPGNDIALTGDSAESDFQALVAKCETMYEAGVRSFALFFDDISLRQSNAGELHAQLLNRFNNEFIKAKGDITPLITVPTQYDSLAMRDGTGLKDYTVQFSETLDDDIIVLWTGPAVVPDGIHTSDGEFFTSVYGKRGGIWWNYPCNDYQLTKLGLGPIYNLDNELTGMMDTFVMNPMGWAELSKITLGTGAEYSWSGMKYDWQSSFDKVIELVYGDLADAMKVFANHSSRLGASSFSCGRPDAPDVKARMMQALKEAASSDDFAGSEIYAALMADFDAMISAADTLQASLDADVLATCTGHLDKLRQVGQADKQALELLNAKVSGDEETAVALQSELSGKPSSLASGKLVSENTGVQFIRDVLDYSTTPAAGFTLSKTFALPGESVQLVNTSSLSAGEFTWKCPGAVISESHEESPVISYEKEGVYTIALYASNKFGKDELVQENCIVISSQADQPVINLALNGTATAIGQTGSAESADKAIDGLETTKWCCTNWGSKWLQVDLGAEKSLTGFTIKHALVGGEGAGLNTRAYRIQLSSDGQTWSTPVTVTDNTEGTTTHSIPVTNARYARLYVDTATQGNDRAARIFEFEVYGIDGSVEIPPVYQISNKTLLSAAIAYADAAKEEPSWQNVNSTVKAAFEKALADARTVYEDPMAEQSAVNEAWNKLSSMIHYLGFTSDKGALQAAVEQYREIYENIDQYEGDTDAFKAAYEEALRVLESETSLDASIEEARKALEEAAGGVHEIVVELDRTLLEYLVSQCTPVLDELETRYMSEGQEAFIAAFENAQNTLKNAKTQEEIDSALSTLHESWLALRLKADESLLGQLREFSALLASLDAADYSTEDWNTISAFTDRLNAVLSRDEVEKIAAEKIAEEVPAIRSIVENRKLASSIDGNTDDSSQNLQPAAKPDSKADSVKTSAGLLAPVMTSLGAAAAAFGAVILRRRKK